jgi:hypothetical protein
MKMGAVAAVGAVLGAAGLWGAMELLGPVTPEVRYIERPGTVAERETAVGKDAVAQEKDSARSAKPRNPTAGTGDASGEGKKTLGDFKLTPEEAKRVAEFLREERRKEQERQEALRVSNSDNGLAVIKAVRAGADASAFIQDFESVRQRFKVEGTTVKIGAPPEGETVDLAVLAKDASIVEFGPGRFVLSSKSSSWTHHRTGVRSLEIRGAGMDTTVIVPSEGGNDLILIWEGSSIENLLVHDLTIDCGKRGSAFIDVRGEASVLVENVRFRGWKSAGHGAPIGVSGAVFLAVRGCEFLGDGTGVKAISPRGPVIALVEDCLFSNLRSALIPSNYAEKMDSRVHLLRCRFEGTALSDRDPGRGETGKLRMVVRSANVRFGAPDLTDEVRHRAWGAQWAEEVTEVSWSPAQVMLPLETLTTVAASVRSAKGELPINVRVESRVDGELGFYVATLDANLRKGTWLASLQGGTPVETRDRGGGHRMDDLKSTEGILDLGEAVRRSGISLATDVREASLSTQGSADSVKIVWNLVGAPGWPYFLVDARTGELLQKWGPQ